MKQHNSKGGRNFIALLLLFSLSVLIRVPNLDRPLSKHHEFNAALILIPMDNWSDEGTAQYHYAPVMSYSNAGDQGINNITNRIETSNDPTYYLSFSPITYLLPYSIFQLLKLKPSAFALQIFNLSLHLISVLLLFLIVRLIGNDDMNRAAWIAVLVYLFSSMPLWFHGNGYTHHVLLIPFVLSSLYIFLILEYKKKKSFIILALITISLFLTAYTAWLGVMFSASFSVYGIVNSIYKKQFNHLIWIPLLASIAALYLFWINYSGLFNDSQFSTYLWNRFTTRSTASVGIFDVVLSLGKWYIIGYGLFVPLLLLLLFLSIRNQWKLNKFHWVILALVILPSFLHHFIFGEFTVAHNYSVLIDGLFIAIAIGLLASKLMQKQNDTRLIKMILFGGLIIGVAEYFYINQPGEMSWRGDRYDSMQKIGQSIAEKSDDESTIFIIGLGEHPAPQVMYYAKRNFLQVNSVYEAEQIMKNNHRENGHVFIVQNMKIVDDKKLQLPF